VDYLACAGEQFSFLIKQNKSRKDAKAQSKINRAKTRRRKKKCKTGWVSSEYFLKSVKQKKIKILLNKEWFENK
jgi:hypothetical protein